MDKRKAAEMVGLDFGYVLEAANYFNSLDETFNWIYLTGHNYELSQQDLIKQLSAVTVEQMKEVGANTPAEYMVLDHDHTYITSEGIAYLRITR
ncbi:hypothetical protein JMM81_09305 [Bacillus sp. V3B]|uniref:hypothetical protein n=1 Tax=Bacillus sp. V3B TaxID=2804915 RepID=UPI00210A5C38|nr:hypothetical protein [Bacillus sp. V3B]MCQ6275158.1 hypothetical protein [Bacillus sp. V3B]